MSTIYRKPLKKLCYNCDISHKRENNMTCTFFGHRECFDLKNEKLESVIEKLIVKYDVKLFYVGNNGGFDYKVISILKTMKTKYPVIKYYIVLPYIPRKNCFDDTITLLPDGIENIPCKYAISYRNKWMIEKSDIVITYVIKEFGGAAKFAKLAKNKGKIIVSLSENIT